MPMPSKLPPMRAGTGLVMIKFIRPPELLVVGELELVIGSMLVVISVVVDSLA